MIADNFLMPIYKLLCLLIIVSKLHSWFLFLYLFIVASVIDKHKVDITLKLLFSLSMCY